MPRPNRSSTYAQNPEPTITVLLNGKPLTSLIDTGCSRTLVQSQYIPRDMWNEDETASIVCVHGDRTELPTADIYIEIHSQPYLMSGGSY